MTGHTPGYALPYPEGGDRVAIHTDVRALAMKSDVELATKPSQSEMTASIGQAVAPLAPRSWVADEIATAVDTTGLLSAYLAARGA
ncbi:MAG: hypothetical protein L0G94_03895 [Brachybacterium sp.]|uniref:hypothetical protein n=1 Tax=Brachybacterium sp. TaxID=1891286 RepID=UPI0026474394|nr:hypothetical protein [Brachybacterium sp.]MDN5685812.1 hypothetical protein [Brachybacterium sp.]